MKVQLFSAALLVAVSTSFAQIPRTLSYEGFLADSAGAPKPDGSYNFTFRLYNVSSGGSAIWSESQSLQVKRGLFSTLLGTLTPVPDSVRFERQYWLGIQIGAGAELSPRVQLASVGSSFSALQADVAKTVSDGGLTGAKIAPGQVVKSINNLHDNLTMRGANGASVTANGDTITITASGGGGGGIGTLQNTDNSLSIINPAGPTTTVNLKSPFTINGNVGIGTTAPNHRLRISGGPVWTSNGWLGAAEFDNASALAWRANTANNRFGIGATNGGLTFFRTASDPGTSASPAVYDMVINDAGNVGIGTLSPNSRLEIAAQDGLAITGYQPFLTLRDASNGNERGVIQSVDGGLNLFADSYLTGTNPSAYLALRKNGNVGIGTATPTGGKLQVVGGGGAGSAIGLYSSSYDNYAVYGSSTTSLGVFGESAGNVGVRARTGNASRYAVYADNTTNSDNYCGLAGYTYALETGGPAVINGALYILGSSTSYISGNLHVSGFLEASGTKSFRIDHPSDPANRFLLHSSVESNERLDVYSGTIVTDGDGNATVQLPSYFQVLNIDYRYQLTVVGEEFAQARVSRRIDNNQFSIKTDKPNVEICWQVTGTRNDPYARTHPFVAEEDKTPEDRGKFLHPELVGQPKEKGIGYRPVSGPAAEKLSPAP